MSQPATHIAIVFGEPGDVVPEAQFNDWYDNVHIPDLLTAPGVLAAVRYKATDSKQPSWVVFYEIESPEVLQSEEIQGNIAKESKSFVVQNSFTLNLRLTTLKFSRSAPDISLPLRGEFALMNFMQPSSEKEAEFLRWYEDEHIGAVAKTPGWMRGGLYEVLHGPQETAGNPNPSAATKALKYLAFHELSNLEHLSAIDETIKTPRGLEMLKDVGDNVEHRIFQLYKHFPKQSMH
ncbi:hypothetical protein ONZ45_g16494 [Pleurotus djamor]|nr:hypothetical protein ONZ45_g16494 [Pleurotus djamor]